MTTTPPTVDVVVVSWNHGRWLPACVQSIHGLTPAGFTIAEIVVVDNASIDPVRAEPDGPSPSITVITNRHNRGFAAACNQGAARGRADYLLFLNPDCRLAPDSLARAMSVLHDPRHASVGLLGLRLADEDGVSQRSCGRFPSFATITSQVLGLSRVAPAHFPGVQMTDWRHDESRTVDFVCAAGLVIRRSLFVQLGGFNERLFLYLEDADLARRARQRGWSAYFCADATAVHASGWSSGKDRGWRLAHSWRSFIVYAGHHLSIGGALGVTAIVTLLAPIARLMEAVATPSRQGVIAIGRAWILLWQLLANDVRSTWTPTPAQDADTL